MRVTRGRVVIMLETSLICGLLFLLLKKCSQQTSNIKYSFKKEKYPFGEKRFAESYMLDNKSSLEERINKCQTDVNQDKTSLVEDKLKLFKPSTKEGVSIQEKIIKSKSSKKHDKHLDRRLQGFVLVNDNRTYVFSAHYDDRARKAEVKIITLAPRDINYTFTCSIYYPDKSVVNVSGYFKYIHASCVPFTNKHRYQNGFIICSVSKARGRPSFLSIHKSGKQSPRTYIPIRVPSTQRYQLTRCNEPFNLNYSNVLQLVWNTELLRLYGVEKFIFYLESQSQSVVDVIQTYVKDGMAEIRNINILKPGAPVKKFMSFKRNWAQFAANTDCLMSQVNSTKYILFIDSDEVVVPRKHKTVTDLADDIFKDKHFFKNIGSLVFRNVYFPTFMEKTKVGFQQKDLALKYNVEPLLHTTRLHTSDIRIAPKSLVRPETVDVMCVHQVDRHRNRWQKMIIEEENAILHHYRGRKNSYMYPPATEDNYMLKMSSQLISAVRGRLRKAGIGH